MSASMPAGTVPAGTVRARVLRVLTAGCLLVGVGVGVSAHAATTASTPPTAPSTSPSDVSVGVSPETSGATATYTVGFVTSANGALTTSSNITIYAPIGTVFPVPAADYTVNGSPATQVGVGYTSTYGAYVVTIASPVAAPNDSAVTVSISGVGNPRVSKPTSGLTVSVSTSADPQPISSDDSYRIVPAKGAPSSPAKVTVTTSSATPSAPVTYTVAVTVSASGGLTPGRDAVTLQAPDSGTVFPSWAGDYTIGGKPASSVSSSGATVTVQLPAAAAAVPGGGSISVIALNVVNPPLVGDYTLLVASSRNPVAAASPAYPITAPTGTTVSGVRVVVSPPIATDPQARYTVGFTTSPAGSLQGSSGTAGLVGATPGGTISLTAPSGTSWPANPGAYQVNKAAAASVTVTGGGTQVSITPASGSEPAGSSPVSVVVVGVGNPPYSSGRNALTVATSADTSPVGSPFYRLQPAETSVSDPSVSVDSATPGAVADYTIGFTTSVTGALAPRTGLVTLTAPVGTSFPAAPSAYLVDGQPVSGLRWDAPNEVSVSVPAAVPAATGMIVQVTGVGNPSSAGTQTVGVSTSADVLSVSSAGYTLGSVSSVLAPSVHLDASAAGVTTRYSVSFTTSSTGGLASGATVTLTGPAGTGFPAEAKDYTLNGAAPSAVNLSRSGVTLTLGSTGAPGASSQVTVTAAAVTNPTGQGTGILTVATSVDTNPVASGPYGITGPPTRNPVTGLTVTPSPATAGAAATYSVEFTTSPFGGLAADTATITLPVSSTGPTWPNNPADYQLDGQPVRQVAANPTSVTLSSPVSVPATAGVSLIITGVTNPVAPSPTGGDTLTLLTSADPVPVSSAPYTIGAPSGGPTQVSAVSASVSPTTATATGALTVKFTTSAAGSLQPPLGATSGGSILLSGPPGTLWPVSTSAYTVNGTAPGSVQVTGTMVSLTPTSTLSSLDTNEPGASTPVNVTVTGVGNPTNRGFFRFQVSTTADTAPAASSDVVITPAPTVTGVSPSSGPVIGGSTIRVSGSGFSAASSVSVGGQLVGFRVDSDASLTVANVPPSPGGQAADVVVTVNGVSSPVGVADRYTYVQPAGFTGIAAVALLRTRLGAGSHPLRVAGRVGVPTAGAGAIALLVSATGAGGAGSVTLVPDGAPTPTAAALDYEPGQLSTTTVFVDLPTDGVVDVIVSGAPAQLTVAVTGVFGAGTGGLAVAGLPQRSVDTTTGAGGVQGQLRPGRRYEFPITGRAGVPANATAVALLISTKDPAQPGLLRIYPDGTPAPADPSIGYPGHLQHTAIIIVALPADGKLDINPTAPVSLSLDVVGVFTAPTVYTGLAPTRHLSGYTTHNPSASYLVALTGLPGDAVTGAVTITVTNPAQGGRLTLSWPGDHTPITLTYQHQTPVSLFALVPLPAARSLHLTLTGAKVSVVTDVDGGLLSDQIFSPDSTP